MVCVGGRVSWSDLVTCPAILASVAPIRLLALRVNNKEVSRYNNTQMSAGTIIHRGQQVQQYTEVSKYNNTQRSAGTVQQYTEVSRYNHTQRSAGTTIHRGQQVQ